MTTVTMTILCSERRPFDSDGAHHVCALPENHYSGSSWHRWYGDDGTVKVEWADDWKLGTGRWREGSR